MRIQGQLIETAADVQRICDEHWLEGQRLEFTQAPFNATKVTKEVVALANHIGGHVILGIEEKSIDGRKRASKINPIENCAAEAQNRARSLSDTIDPPIRGVDVTHIVTHPDGAGIIIIEVPQSLFGPHRSTPDKEVYLRSGEESRTQRMTEIHRLVLAFEKREDRVEHRFEALRNPHRHKFNPVHGRFHMRVAATPLVDVSIDVANCRVPWFRFARITTKRGVTAVAKGTTREETERPMLRGRWKESGTEFYNKRAFVHENASLQLIHLVKNRGDAAPRANEVIGNIFSLLCAIDDLSVSCDLPSVEFGIEIEVGSAEVTELVGFDGTYYPRLPISGRGFRFPPYTYKPGSDKISMINFIWTDFWHELGMEPPDTIASVEQISEAEGMA